jgi:hypothetical protein
MTPISKICNQKDFETAGHRDACLTLKEFPNNYHRKVWEFSFIYQSLLNARALKPGNKGLGFGVGREPLVAAFASRGCEITATDLDLVNARELGWVAANEHCDNVLLLNQKRICDDREFRRLVKFRNVDMNRIPDDLRLLYDFTWSSCCLEHLGSIQNGIDFITEQMKCLKHGGIAIHTTEYNLSSNSDTVDNSPTVIFRRRDIESIVNRLKSEGHIIDVDYAVGSGEIESHVDVPPYTSHPHLRLLLSGYTSTSIALVVRKESSVFVRPARESTCSDVPAARATAAASSTTGVPVDRPVTALQIYTGYTFDEEQIIREHFCLTPDPVSGFIVDRLGVKTRGSSLLEGVEHLTGTVIPLPIPQDYHAEAIEWIGLLKSVRSARSRFAAMELGAGWGPWLVAGAVAARNIGIPDVFLLGAEGDPGHFGFLRQHFIDNGLDPNEHLLFKAAVGVRTGRALWPRVAARSDWGSRPIYCDGPSGTDGSGVVSDYLGRSFSDAFEVPVLAVNDLLALQERWDLVHLDVQGEEVTVCEAGLALMNERVHWLVIGTHSRIIEGLLISSLAGAGWILENEKPAKFNFVPGSPSIESMTSHDGTQVWRNPRLDWKSRENG